MSKGMRFIEGEQEIHFPSTWEVIKVDEHPFYRQVSGRGMKSVDFLALDKEWGLYLIELKDYRHHLSPNEKEDLQDVIEEKLEDSKKLIRSIYAMLRSKWRYQFCMKYKVLNVLIPKRSQFWIQAHHMIEENRFTYLIDVVFVK